MVDERDQVVIVARIPDARPQVGQRVVAGILHPDVREVRITRNPRAPARDGGRAPDELGLLQDGDARAAECGNQRAGKTGRAATYDNEVRRIIRH